MLLNMDIKMADKLIDLLLTLGVQMGQIKEAASQLEKKIARADVTRSKTAEIGFNAGLKRQ
tara:strand:+ start:207 stop:389 length:183 start_codon:yes stop_codon:yes gene_type:complete